MNNSEEINPVTFQFLNSTYLKDLRLTYTNYQNGYGWHYFKHASNTTMQSVCGKCIPLRDSDLPDKLTQILFDTAKAPVLEAFVTQTDSLDVFTVAANNYVELSKKLARINGHAYIFENGKFTENLTLIARNDK